METNGNKISIYTVLNRWLYDGSSVSPMPPELIKDTRIGSQYILYYFKSSMYNLYFNKHFNNYDIFQMPRIDILKFLKKCVLLTGYKPPFIPKTKTARSKIAKILKGKFPYYKWHDVDMLVTLIDKREDKAQIYETLGLYQPRKTKTKVIKKEITNLDLFAETPPKLADGETALDMFMQGLKIES